MLSTSQQYQNSPLIFLIFFGLYFIEISMTNLLNIQTTLALKIKILLIDHFPPIPTLISPKKSV
jgi:hypothetical protein